MIMDCNNQYKPQGLLKTSKKYASIQFFRRLIEIIPPDSVRFQYFEDGLIIGNFTISNKTKSIKVFRVRKNNVSVKFKILKILTSSFQNYIVLPSSGILLSRDTLNSQMKINIMMKKQKV